MATRNRTATFVKYRATARAQSSASVPAGGRHSYGQSAFDMEMGDMSSHKLLGDGDPHSPTHGGEGGGSSGMGGAQRPEDVLPPAWVDLADAIGAEMALLRSKMGELAKAHELALRPTFDDASSSESHAHVEALTNDVTRRFKQCDARLKRLGAAMGRKGDEPDAAIRRNVQRLLATELSELSQNLRKLQKDYLYKLQQQQQQQGTGLAFELEERPRGEAGGAGGLVAVPSAISSSALAMEQQLMVVHSMEGLAAEREQEINKIVQSVNDLAQVMRDLSSLVIDQGTILDRIDYNVEQVSAKVEEGTQQLVRAERSQKRSAMLGCIMILAITCLILMVLIVLKKIFLW